MLKHLTEKTCPTCGNTDIVAEKIKTFDKKISVHANGQRWEERHFACGMALEFVPNYSRTFAKSGYSCKNDEDLLKEVQNEIALVDSSIAAIEVLETTANSAKDSILRNLVERKNQLEYKLKGLM